MAHVQNKMVEIRSALLHLHSVVSDGTGTSEKAQEAIDRLASDLSRIYGEDFSNLEVGDSYGEIEYLRWAVDGCQTLLGFDSNEEMEEAISLVDSDGFCNTCGEQECEHIGLVDDDPDGCYIEAFGPPEGAER